MGEGIEEASTTCRNPESIRRTTTDERRNFDRLSRAFRGQSFAQVKLFGRARGTRIMDPNRRLLSSTSLTPHPPTLIPRVFSIKLRDPAVPLTKLTIHKLTFLNNELNYIQSNRSPFFAPINGHFSFIIPHSTLSLILEEHLSLPF